MAKKIVIIIGTRPNFIKVTQFERVFKEHPTDFEYILIHTGQHFDAAMSDIFFTQLELKKPDYHLGVGKLTPANQIGTIISSLSEILAKEQPDLVIVPGDVNSTLASALAAHKTSCTLAHLESGLRSRDREMPEEINRIITDQISNIHFVTESSGIENLQTEMSFSKDVHLVGNTMIDTIVAFDESIQNSTIKTELGIEETPFVLMTMHRPSNVDNEASLKKMLEMINHITADMKLVFPIHPRTKKNLIKFGLDDQVNSNDNCILTGPLDYFAFQKLISDCAFVVTDSGGIQEETTFRQVPCLTIRDNTERPSTLTIGSNTLLPFEIEPIKAKIDEILAGTYKKGAIPELWDGKATERIVDLIDKLV